MMVADQPIYLDASRPVMLIAKAGDEQRHTGQTDRVMGICALVEHNSSGESFDPLIEANIYFNTNPATIDASTAKLRIVRQPKHGTLELRQPMDGRTLYIPNTGYFGNDAFTIEVEGGGHTVKVHYFVRVAQGAGESMFDNKNCKGQFWKVSSSSPSYDGANGRAIKGARL